MKRSKCREFRPDHNGECLTCDEWLDAHTQAAVRAGEARTKITLRRVEGKLDELCALNADVHLECMDDGHWWLSVMRGPLVTYVNFHAKGGRIRVTVDEELLLVKKARKRVGK